MGEQIQTIDKESVKKAYREKVTDFKTASGIEVKEVYGPEDMADIDFEKDINFPGEYPYTRGHHPLMYRGKLWNIREISGVSTAPRANDRFKFLISQGMSAIQCELDGPTWYGLESDQPYCEGQLGICGVGLNSYRDVVDLCEGIPLDAVSFGIATYFPVIWQSYLLNAERRGYDIYKLRGVGGAINWQLPSTVPSYSEMLYINSRISTLGRWNSDFQEYLLKNFPNWNLWFCTSYDFREAGSDAIQEIAFTIACRDDLIVEMQRRGLDVSAVGRRLSPVLSVDRDFFEEIAKLRAARRIWARTMKDKWKVTDPKAMILRMHVNGSGSYLTRQQPLVNIARGTVMAMAGALGGCMGMQIPSFDEAWATPTEEAQRVAIRTQQILRYESGIAKVADPLAGSYYVEWLTKKLEEEAEAMVKDIEDIGGWIAALDSGWVHEQFSKSFQELHKKEETGERVHVGVNKYEIPPEEDFKPETYTPEHMDVETYVDDFKKFKESRDTENLKRKLEDIRLAAEQPETNLLPSTLEALKADATFSEIIGVLRMVDGLEYDWAGDRKYPF